LIAHTVQAPRAFVYQPARAGGGLLSKLYFREGLLLGLFDILKPRDREKIVNIARKVSFGAPFSLYGAW
jgi:hypothetical protein